MAADGEPVGMAEESTMSGTGRLWSCAEARFRPRQVIRMLGTRRWQWPLF